MIFSVPCLENDGALYIYYEIVQKNVQIKSEKNKKDKLISAQTRNSTINFS